MPIYWHNVLHIWWNAGYRQNTKTFHLSIKNVIMNTIFYWGNFTFKGSLLSVSLMLNRFFARNWLSPDFYGSQFGGFFDRRPPHSEFEGTKPPKGTCINRNTTFEPLNVQFGPKLRSVGWPRKRKKNQEKKVTKPLYFTTMWRRHFTTKFGEF